jgi:osmotically-inducible protein OsmY
LVCVAVHDGTVDLTGIVDSQVEKTAIAVLAEEAIGVRGVSNELRIRPLSSDG